MKIKVKTIFSDYEDQGWKFKYVPSTGRYGLFSPDQELVYEDYDCMVGAKKLVEIAKKWEKKYETT